MKKSGENRITLIIFMGQSNMAGRGDVSEAVPCHMCAGWEFRAVSDPNKLYPIIEPFGCYENRPGKIDDGKMKKGSLVSAFAETYYQKTGQPVVAVSASIGGTASDQWVSIFADDAAARLAAAIKFLKSSHMPPEHIYMVWCQGETDGDNNISGEKYKTNFKRILKKMQREGVEKCFLIQIGHFNYIKYPAGNGVKSGEQLDTQYEVIRKAQEDICREADDVIMAASFSGYMSLMRDSYHYYQEAYNLVGSAVAEITAEKEKQPCYVY